LLRDAELGHRALHGRQDRVVAAPGTPPDLLVRHEVLLGERGLRRDGRRVHSRVGHGTPYSSWSIRAAISEILKGRPWIFESEIASTRAGPQKHRKLAEVHLGHEHVLEAGED